MHNVAFKREHTSSQKQNVIHALVRRLDAVHSYVCVVVVAYVKWHFTMHGVNPVSHFWVILHHVDSGQWQLSAVFYTLQKYMDIKLLFFVQNVFVYYMKREHRQKVCWRETRVRQLL